ncbi:hypothetical protein LOTGIDRAFT_105309 [Lottia gigantea]|uniref:Sulfatase N-terminal domain-containing protein n=1 Tax=Lottia gigantea TaxID=225164 RepID=V4A402_LOTGI|nr:hypothetical protein LOTGIDRAFT_105309 [Lottia gigantea]ESO91397.1 hypothetical protein LOTGIDRAFT_105309 [Lottia gigantea]
MAKLLSIVLIIFIQNQATTSKKPHILFIVADDLGWNDIGFRNLDILTPTIDKLASQGVIFNSSYVLPVCSPSRSAFLSGYYPFKTGFQHFVLGAYQNVCLPLDLTLLPQQMKKAGYATHAVGKWHLGFCNWNCTPTYRGFDSYLGYYNAATDHYTHKLVNYYDMHDNEKPAWKYYGQYAGYFFTDRSLEIIRSHDTDIPLFLYLPFQNVHEPIQVPEEYADLYPHVGNYGRKHFSGMVSFLDESIKNITYALRDKNMLNDTLILFTADNGAELLYYGNNYPLRGGKHTLWEGGTRATAFMTGYGLQHTGIHYDGLIHAVDWMPTLIGAAGAEQGRLIFHVQSIPGIDGINQWDSIRMNQPSKRTEFIYNLDDFFIPSQGQAAIRDGDWKLILGYPGLYDGWYKPMNDTKDTPLYDFIYTPGDKPARLFNIKDDPNEYNDVSKEQPEIVQKLTAKISEYRKSMVPALYPKSDPEANTVARRNGGVWTPGWC